MSALTYIAAWQPVAARIRGIERAAALHARFLAGNSQSPYGADKDLQHHCEGVKRSIDHFQATFQEALPASAHEAITRFLSDGGKQITDNSAGDAKLVRTIIVKLVAFEAEVSFALSQPLEQVRLTTELAFMHLQRLIVADAEYRKKWILAHKAGETKCEHLGAVHLLWHGIWAFKADASGGRTDLIYQDRPNVEKFRGPVGMVLTEWKNAKTIKPAIAFDHAKRQAQIYAGGILAGFELATHRYLVVVTKKGVEPPQDHTDSGITYRYINIAVEPDSPSVAAKTSHKDYGSEE